MGEIRSTLDIIMEKTKDLTMSNEEKKQYRKQEISGKIKGLMQRYADGILDLGRLGVEMAAFQDADKVMADRLIRREVLSRVEPGKDNDAVLRVLEEILRIDIVPIRKLLGKYEAELEQERVTREKAAMERLEKKGISGSAVLQNPAADPHWPAFVAERIQEFKESLASFEKSS